MRKRTHITRLIALTLVGGFVLSACGIRGELKTPPPLWGDKSAPQEETKDNKPDADKPESNT